jgi:hypothetical protein
MLILLEMLVGDGMSWPPAGFVSHYSGAAEKIDKEVFR